jgi:hypothetical protein
VTVATKRPKNPVIREILRQGKGKDPRLVAAALETGKIESNYTNLPGGDADSVNWRQERASIYGGDMSIRRSVARFYKEAEGLDRGQPSYELAADVQRPAAQYRGRYKTAQGEALSLLKPSGPRQVSSPASPPVYQPAATPGVDNSQLRQQAALAYLQQGGIANSAATSALAGQYQALKDVPGVANRAKVQAPVSPSSTGGVSGVRVGTVRYAPTANRPGVDMTPGIQKLLKELAGTAGPITVGTGTNHSQMTANGNVSDHWEGNAADIPATGTRLTTLGADALLTYANGKTVQWLRNDGQVESVRVTAANARRLAASGGIFNVPYGSKRRIQVIANTHQGGDHTNHLHVGVTAV